MDRYTKDSCDECIHCRDSGCSRKSENETKTLINQGGDSIGLIKNPHKTEKHHLSAVNGSRNYEDDSSISH